MYASGVCQRMISGTMSRSEPGSRAVFRTRRIPVQRQHAARDGVAGGVVAADDQQDQVARTHRWHVAVSLHARAWTADRSSAARAPARHANGEVLETLEERRATHRLRGGPPASAPDVAMSDQWVSLRRSSNGKSKIVASICVVSSMETRSTQSKVSPVAKPSRMPAARSRSCSPASRGWSAQRRPARSAAARRASAGPWR